MMDFNTVDIIIAGLILFLSIKGLVNGFSKELFNFIGLIGGVAVAARVNTTVGEFIHTNIFPVEHEPALKLIGFISVLLGIWMLLSFIASIVDKVSSDSVGFFSRVLGYLLTATRYTAIFALIVVGVQNSEFLSEKFSKHYENSQAFPILSEIGTELLNIEARTEGVKEESNSTIQDPIDLNVSFDVNMSERNESQ